MAQIIQHTKGDIRCLFENVSIDILPQSFQVLLQSFPEVLTSENLPPTNESQTSFDIDEAIVPNQKKIFGNKPFHFQPQQQPQTMPLPPIFPSKTQSSDNYNSFNYRARSMIRTPFSSSGYSTDLGERVWFYIDEQNEIQGPFTTLEMDSWFEKGFLFDELKICHSLTNKFFPLYDLFVIEKGVKSANNLDFELSQSMDKVMKKQGSDIAHKEHYSNKNENKMFETLQNVLTQQPVLKPNLNDPAQNMERNIKHFNVIYPNMSGNNNEIPQIPKNICVAPINPNFNPLLSQSNKPALSKPDQQNTFSNPKAPSPQNQNLKNSMQINNHLKNSSDPKIDQAQQMNKDAKPFFFNNKKDLEKNFESKTQEKTYEKKNSKNENDFHLKSSEEPRKKSLKTEYVKVYEPKKPVPAVEKEVTEDILKPKPEETKIFDKDNFEYVKNEKLLKDLKHNKGNIDKEKYFIVYQAKQENQPEVRERKLSQGKEDINKNEKKSKKKNRKLHSSNSPEEKEGPEKLEEGGNKGKFNSHLFQKENKNTNKPGKPAFVKEYVLKK